MSISANALFAAKSIGARMSQLRGYTFATLTGARTISTFVVVGTHLYEFALLSTPSKTGKLEIYRFNNKGLASFIGYAHTHRSAVARDVIDAARLAGLCHFSTSYCKAA